jgi:hypothetical protein
VTQSFIVVTLSVAVGLQPTEDDVVGALDVELDVRLLRSLQTGGLERTIGYFFLDLKSIL